MHEEPDVVVVGSGHNGLVTAAYLAAAGKRVHVLERQQWLGGGVVTRELTRPGFKHELHALGHIMILANPLIEHDELRLIDRYGLSYLPAKVPHAATFDDGTSIALHGDRERTRDAIARISPRDAEAYVHVATLAERVIPLMLPGLFVPPAPLGEVMASLDSTEEGRALITMMGKSIDDLVNKWFEDERVRFTFIRLVSVPTLTLPQTKGVGLLALASIYLLERFGMMLVEGGSGGLTDALVRCIEDHGGVLEGGVDVDRVVVRRGRAVGVRTTDGREITASDAVVGMFHPHHIDRYFDDLEPRLVSAARATETSEYTGFLIHAALNEPLRFRAGAEAADSYFNEVGTPRLLDMYDGYAEIRRGDLPTKLLFGAATPSTGDPTRAPEGKGILHLFAHAPYELREGGTAAWEHVKEEFADRLLARLGDFVENLDGNVIDRHLVTPADHERTSSSFVDGDVHGIAPFSYQTGSFRPIPELAQYTIPGISNFYLTGPFMHPGGGVTGGGRATAIKIAQDLGLELPLAEQIHHA